MYFTAKLIITERPDEEKEKTGEDKQIEYNFTDLTLNQILKNIILKIINLI